MIWITNNACYDYYQIERLRKEGNRILEETQEQLRRDMEEKLNKPSDEIDSDEDEIPTAKIKVHKYM